MRPRVISADADTARGTTLNRHKQAVVTLCAAGFPLVHVRERCASYVWILQRQPSPRILVRRGGARTRRHESELARLTIAWNEDRHVDSSRSPYVRSLASHIAGGHGPIRSDLP